MFYGKFSPKTRRKVNFMTEGQTRVHVEAKEARSHVTTSVLLSRVLLIVLLVLASCSMLVSQARAAAPTVVTMPATGVTATSAVLQATVNPNGLVTTWDFSNPPTTYIYCPSPAASLPGDNVVHAVSCTATGLTPSTYYEYMVRASSSGGNSFGSSVGFTTAAVAATDWVLSSPTLSPASPNAGDAVTFGVILIALSSGQPYPQVVTIVAQLDGMTIASKSVAYPGPTGLGMDLYSAPPWTATAGTHTMVWQVTGAVPDPNPANNQASSTFTVGPPPAPFDFDISVSPTEQTVSPGGSVSYTVNVNLISGSTKSVSLSASGEPSGVTKMFSPSSGNPMFSSSLTLTVASSASPGSYSITVTGTGGGEIHAAAFTLIISQAEDFRIDVNPASLTVAQGQVASYSFNVVGLNGFNSQVSLSVSGYPSGANSVLSVPSGTPDFSTILTVTLPSNVQTGSFTLTITGTGGGLNRVANVVLIITTQTQTSTQTQTQAQTTITTTTATTTPELLETILDMLQQNSLLVIGLFALVIIVLLALVLTRRKPSYQPPSSPPPPTKPCPTCGKSLTFVSQYDRWYCNNCQEYK